MKEKNSMYAPGAPLMEVVHTYREEERPLTGQRWDGEECYGEDLSGVEWKGCLFSGCRLEECDLSGWELEDVRLENCDLTGCDLSGCRMRRVVFSGCRLTGCRLTQGAGREVRWENCLAQYADFARGHWREMQFSDCRMGGTSFADCQQPPAFARCDLRQCNFFHTPLKDVDVRDSLFSGVTVDTDSLRGLIVTPEQAAELAVLFGLKVRP